MPVCDEGLRTYHARGRVNHGWHSSNDWNELCLHIAHKQGAAPWHQLAQARQLRRHGNSFFTPTTGLDQRMVV